MGMNIKELERELLTGHQDLEDDYQTFLNERKAIVSLPLEERLKIETVIRIEVLKVFKQAKTDKETNQGSLGFFYHEAIRNIPYVQKYFRVQFVHSDRNIGKTFSARRLCLDVIRKDKKFMWWRNIDDEVESQVMSDMEVGGWLNTNGWVPTGKKAIPNIVDLAGNVVGYYRPINTSAKFKSIDFPRTNIVVYEEYNEVKIKDKFLKMVKMISTVQRHNADTFFIGQANYVDQQDDVLQNLGVGSKKLTKYDFVMFNWVIGAIILNIPKGIYKQFVNKQKDIGYRSSLGNFKVWKNQFGGGFANEEPVNIIKEETFTSVEPVFNIYVENATNVNKTYGAYKLTLYHVWDEEGKEHNVLREMVGTNDKPIFVLDNLNQIRYPQAMLINPQALEQLITNWNKGNLKTISVNTHDVITMIFAKAKQLIDRDDNWIDDVENIVEGRT